MPEPRTERTRADYERGLPDHHDPTAGIGGAPPARSALTLRLVLAVFGLVVCVGAGILAWVSPAPAAFAIVLWVLAAVAVVDIGVITRRKARGEPG